MKNLAALFVLAVCVGVIAAPAFADKEKPPEPPPPPAEVKKTVDALAGKWKHDVTMSAPGMKAPVKFVEKIECKRVAGGRAVACTDTATIKGMGKVDFSYLVAYDAERKAIHWFAVGSTGEVHDHTCRWKDDKTIDCEPLRATMGGQPITETFQVTVEGAKQTLTVSIAGKDGVTKIDTIGKRTGK